MAGTDHTSSTPSITPSDCRHGFAFPTLKPHSSPKLAQAKPSDYLHQALTHSLITLIGRVSPPSSLVRPLASS
ncbi:hypothetical protein E2C01_069210 [Portunus trituberculatus]|uniref:Uncharacterized protein n=1 Tax=Portunus trituberculatus TaxID=210409 RepID=A0A5B7I266_PORTR|nr:hypothetical protein [Portunus trituberculatus]